MSACSPLCRPWFPSPSIEALYPREIQRGTTSNVHFGSHALPRPRCGRPPRAQATRAWLVPCCSGTEIPLVVWRSLADVAKRVLGVEVRYRHSFSAENDVAKQRFLTAMHPEVRLLYRDCLDLPQDRAFDVISVLLVARSRPHAFVALSRPPGSQSPAPSWSDGPSTKPAASSPGPAFALTRSVGVM